VAGTRPVRLERADSGRRDVPVHDGAALVPGHRIAGPALVDGSDTTVWVPPGSRARVDAVGTLLVEIGA